MRMPVKLNKSHWPAFLTRLLPSSEDPRILLHGEVSGERFSKAVSVFKFGTTLKSTRGCRFPLTVEALAAVDYDSPPIVLDVGASDGVTSLHVMQSLDCAKYYVTDLNIEVLCVVKADRSYFYDSSHRCVLMVTERFVVYSEFEDAIFPFNKLGERFFLKVPRESLDFEKIELIHPDIKEIDRNVIVAEYDVFEEWAGEKADLIIAANLLNRAYFPDARIVQAVGHLLRALNDGGRLAVVDNRKIEKATLFRRADGRTRVERDINGGTEIRGLITKDVLV